MFLALQDNFDVAERSTPALDLSSPLQETPKLSLYAPGRRGLGHIQLRNLYEKIFLQPLCYQPPMAELAGKLSTQEHLSLQVISHMDGI
jgi:hypothetical protein